MENPRSWGPLEQAIAEAIQESDQHNAVGVSGPSVVVLIANKLRDLGYIKPQFASKRVAS